MFEVGQKYKLLKKGTLEQKDTKWVKAIVEHIPENGRFVQFRLHFVNVFGEHTSYTESFTMNQLDHMIRDGELVRR